MRELYVTLGSIHAVVVKTGHTWKTVRAVCCPEQAFKKVDAETIELVRQMKKDCALYKDIREATGLPRATIAAIIAGDSGQMEVLKKTRADRMMVEEDMLAEELAETIEKRRDAGRLTVSELTNAKMVNGIIIKEAGGSAPARIKHEADPSLMMAAQMFAGVFKGVPVPSTLPVQDAVIVPNKPDQPEPEPEPEPTKTRDV